MLLQLSLWHLKYEKQYKKRPLDIPTTVMSAPYFFAKAAVVATAYKQIWTNSEPKAKKSIGFNERNCAWWLAIRPAEFYCSNIRKIRAFSQKFTFQVELCRIWVPANTVLISLPQKNGQKGTAGCIYHTTLITSIISPYANNDTVCVGQHSKGLENSQKKRKVHHLGS